jgi:Emfourin
MVRSGGVAGRRVRASVDTDTDPDGDWYAGQLATLDLPALAATASTEASPDRYQYVLSVHADDGSQHRLELGEAGLPDALRPLVTQLEARARAH